MAAPQTYQAWRRTTGAPPLTLQKSTEHTPSDLKPSQVLIRIHAVSLNYRDVAMLHGKYPAVASDRGVPASDCAAEVVDVGSAVNGFARGDKVAPIFDLENKTGTEIDTRALGGDVDGVLRQYAVFDQDELYHLPPHLSWEEAATITCAGVTAWNALSLPETMDQGKTAVLQGTGGVSIFGGQTIHTVNYKANPKWEDEVQKITNGKGADILFENAGVTTIAQSLASIGRRGHVSLIGFLGGLETEQFPDTIHPLLFKSATLRGISVGSKIQHQQLSKFLADKKVSLKPLIDKVFDFDDAPAAFDYLYSAKHSGKVVIKL